jgi:signal transduction histidine kinase
MRAVLARILESKPLAYSAAIIFATVASAFFFPGGPGRVFSATEFLPHATCYLQNRNLITLHVVTDLLIGLAYVSISGTLAYLVWKASKDIPFHWMFLSFGIFIVSCGFTHFMEVWTVWQSVYWLSGYVKAITAAASVVTAIALFPLVPKIFSLIRAVRVSEERRSLLETTSRDLARANESLQDRKQELEIANRELEMFTYSVAHDLRAPLRAMRGYAEVLNDDYAERLDQTGQDYGRRIVKASDQMDRLLADLLAYSTMSRKEVELQRVNLPELFAQVQAAQQSEIDRREAKLAVLLEAEYLQADPTFLIQILSNLLSNALRYVPAERRPEIAVNAKREGAQVLISVRDNGIGIDPKYHDRIFRLFERLSSTSSGTGLGLPIVKRAVERMRGEIGLDSVPGQGTTFWVRLPAES